MLFILTPFLFMLLAAALCICRPRDTRWPHLFFATVSLVPIMVLSVQGLNALSGSSRRRYDQYFFLADKFFGSPAFYLGQIVSRFKWLETILIADYSMYVFIAFSVVAVNFMFSDIARGYRTLLAMVLSSTLASIIYTILPASGPSFAFAGYPFVIPVIVIPHVIYLTAAPNCFPSGHLTVALLAAVYLWRWNAGRIFASVHVLLTTLATLGLGEHYLIDLLAAIPFTVLLVYVSRWPFRQRKVEPKPEEVRIVDSMTV